MTGRNPTAAEFSRSAKPVPRPALTITWRPLTEKPTGKAVAMIRTTDPEGVALLPGPVVWSISYQGWCDEDTMRPLKLTMPGVTYHWCPEHEIIGANP